MITTKSQHYVREMLRNSANINETLLMLYAQACTMEYKNFIIDCYLVQMETVHGKNEEYPFRKSWYNNTARAKKRREKAHLLCSEAVCF